MKPFKNLPLISMREYGCVVFIMLFLCVSVVFVGISCDESTGDSINTKPTVRTNGIEIHLSDISRELYTNGLYRYDKYDSDTIALWMIEKHLGEMVELMREHKCSSK